MDKPIAYMNHGRWICDCPRCGNALPARENGVVCPVCWPGMVARALKPLKNGTFRQVADVEIVQRTRAEAEKSGELYMPAFPENRVEIERVLRDRAREHMNWERGETLAFLRAENRTLGVSDAI